MKKTEKKNKKTAIGLVIAIVFVAVVAIVFVLVLGKKETFRTILVNDEEGSVKLERDEKNFEVTKDMKLIPNDFVTVGEESLLDLLVDDDKHIAVRSKTKFSVDAVGNQEEGQIAIRIKEGKTYIKIDHPLEPDDEFLIKTPNATVSVRGTTFTVEYDSMKGVTRVECVDGKVDVTSKSGEEASLQTGDVIEVVDIMTMSSLSQPEIDAIENVFLGGDGVVEYSEETEEAEEETDVTKEETVEEEESVIAEILQADVGDIVTFGTYGIAYREYYYSGANVYEVSKDSNPETPIEWIVLAKDGDSVTLFSKYVLDIFPYKWELDEPVTWEDSAIRVWLNRTFYDNAFTENEKEFIKPTTCINGDNTYYGVAGGNDTEDRVYLLSLEEVEQYFGVDDSDFDRYKNGELTWEAYATLCNEKSEGMLLGETMTTDGSCWWWLRSPGYNVYNAACVGNGGVDMYGSNGINIDQNEGVRPVIRIGL